MVVLGYALILAYVFSLIFLLGPWVVKRAGVEFSRKVIHTLLFLVWVLLDLFFRHTVHQIVVPLLFLLLNALSYKFRIYKSVEREKNNHLGTVYFAAAISVVMTLAYRFPVLYHPSGVAAFCLTFGDGLAALIGRHFPSRPIRGSKTRAGFLACFAACVLSLSAFRLVYWRELSLVSILILSGVAAIAELTGGGLDNFAIPFSVLAVSYALTADPNGTLAPSLGLAVGIFFLVALSGAITFSGSLLSMGIVFSFCCFGGGAAVGFLLWNYLVIFFVGLLRRRRRPKNAPGSGGRNALQILINGGLGTLCVVLYGLTAEKWLLLTGLVSIGGNFIDSLSSDVGTLSRRAPFDPVRRIAVPTGLSGGITVLGTGTALAFSLIIGGYLVLTLPVSLSAGILAALLVFAQTAVDTLLGSLLQVKYRCPGCGTVTESRTHCGISTEVFRGISWLDNNLVNLASSFLITGLAALLFRQLTL